MAAPSPLLIGLVAGSFAWPGALEADGRALAALPEPDRPAAVEALVERYGAQAAFPYLEPLLEDPEPEVRVYVGRVLARAGDPRALAAALDWVTAPGRPPVDRAFGLDLLAHAAALPPPARRAIEQAIRDRGDPGLRMRALEALAMHEIAPSLPVVLGALDDDSREVRQQAVLAVATAARQAPAAAIAATLPLLDRLEDADRLIRLGAIRALGALRDPRAVRALVRVASVEPSDLAAAAADALGAPPMVAAVPALARLAGRTPADDLARRAALALGEIGTPAAIDTLLALLRAPPVPDEVKLALLHAGPAAVAPLAREIVRGTPASAALAAPLLAELGDRRATPALAAAAEARSAGAAVVLVAIDALARLKDPAAVPALAHAAGAAPPDVRLRAFTALGTLGDPRGAAVIEAGLGDTDPRVRAAAAALAGAIDARASAAGLADRLADVDPAVRRAAARALARLGPTPGTLTRVLTVLAAPHQPARDVDELGTLGDALETNVTDADAERIERAFLADGPDLQIALGRAVAAAHVDKPLANRAVIDGAIAHLPAGGAPALAAADVLSVAHLAERDVALLARAFADAEPVLRARLCPAVARLPHGGLWLAALIASPDESLPVRAAAAWSARDLPEARPALAAAARTSAGPLGDNARSALAGGAHDGGSAAVRLHATDGHPIVGRWVTLTCARVAVQAMTDETGVARVDGLPPATAAWSAAGFSLRDGP